MQLVKVSNNYYQFTSQINGQGHRICAQLLCLLSFVSTLKQARQCMYNVRLGYVCATIFVVEMQEVF